MCIFRRILRVQDSTPFDHVISDSLFTLILSAQESADARPIWEIEERLRSNYEEYLRVTNEKAGVYRDIILTDDYDPLKTRSATIKVAPRIRDPMKVELNKTMRERMQMGNPGKPSQGRDTFDTTCAILSYILFYIVYAIYEY